jgi:predicted RecB family nuclease
MAGQIFDGQISDGQISDGQIGSAILLDSYAAKTCPYALHLDRVAPPQERLELSAAAAERIASGVAFEELVGAALGRLVLDWVAFPPDRSRDDDPEGWAADRSGRRDGTLRAIESGVIWNPRLPPDRAGHRSGEPDLLVRSNGGGRVAYLPVDVKAHFAAVPRSRHLAGSLVELTEPTGSGLTLLPPADAAHREDLLQLAHYWRMLEAIDVAPEGEPRGAIVGWSGRVDGSPAVALFALGEVCDEYELAFDRALKVVDRAVAISAGAVLPALGAPWYVDSCQECGWRAVCGPELVARRHVSLVRPDRRIRAELETSGIATFDELAEVSDRAGSPGGESAAWREAIGRARMACAGDPVPFSLLAEVGGPSTALPRLWRKPDAPASWSLTRRDVELDVDMESVPSGAYLWGTLLTYVGDAPPFEAYPPGYRGFGDRFEPPGDSTTAAVFLQFLEFVERLRETCAQAGRSFGAFCYSGGSAEIPALRRARGIVAERDGIDVSHRIEALVESDGWVDLLPEVRQRVRSLNGLGLKVVARATGFSWRAEDAGGEASMAWYRRATEDPDPAVRASFQRKILEYNEDDVAATLHLRSWFSSHPPEELALVP